MKLGVLLDASGVACPHEMRGVEVTQVVSDSRLARTGCVFVCIRGIHHDGHEFIENALYCGAAAVVVEGTYDANRFVDAPIITVENTRLTLAYLMDAWYGHPSEGMKFVAITGTNGKTSVAFILKKIFEAASYRCGLIGTVSCLSMGRRLISDNKNRTANMTTPDPEQLYGLLAQMVSDGVEYVFIEATSHALCLDKLAPIRFMAAVFTNLTPDHLDFHGSMKNYLSAKKKLFTAADIAIINMDSEFYDEIANAAQGRTVSCSVMRDEADYRAMSVIDMGTDGFSYRFVTPTSAISFRCHLVGGFNVINTLLAASCAAELGIDVSIINRGIEDVENISGRLEKIKLDETCDFTVFIDYAHTPDALEKLLTAVRGFCRPLQRITVVFGCGGDRDKSKRPIMGEIATRLADHVVITSDNCRSEDPLEIINNILKGTRGRNNFEVISDRRLAIEQVILNARREDVILLAGKGHETYEISNDVRTPFSEREIALAAVAKRNEK